MKSRYICPICSMQLEEEEKRYVCEKSHSFDKSAEGYVNFAAVKKVNTDTSGDASDTCRARHEFLESGKYLPLAEAVCAALKKYAPFGKSDLIVDAGCGEGYYSRRIKEAFPESDVYGIDLAKQGIKTAAKFQKNIAAKNHYSIAGIFDMPFENESAAAVVSVFAPVADAESARVLEEGGILIVACPGKEHLMGLKKALYDTPLENEEKIPQYDGFELCETLRVKYDMTLDGKNAAALFAMTPYFWRSSQEVREKSAELDGVLTPADFIVKIYRKKQ